MKSFNHSFPHPVLGVFNDVRGSVGTSLTITLRKPFIQLSFTLDALTNETLHNLVQQGKVIPVIDMVCSATLFRETYINTYTIEIQSHELNKDVDVYIFLCAAEDFEYDNTGFHEDYSRTKFKIERGNILAIAGKYQFIARKVPSKPNLAQIIKVVKTKDENINIDYTNSEEIIIIYLPEEEYNKYEKCNENNSSEILIGSIVFPVLVDAFYFLQNSVSSNGDEGLVLWERVLKELVEWKKGDNAFEAALKVFAIKETSPIKLATTKTIEYIDELAKPKEDE